MPADWRKIERALADAAKAQGAHIVEGGGGCGVWLDARSSREFLDFSKIARDLQFELEKIGA